MNTEPVVLEVYEAGPLTVVGFGGREIIHDINVAPLHDDFNRLIEENSCEQLAVDLTGVKFIPSGMLGLLTSLHRKGIKIEIYNPSDDVRDVLKTTRLDTMFELRDVDL